MRSCHLSDAALLMDIAALYARHNPHPVEQIYSQASGAGAVLPLAKPTLNLCWRTGAAAPGRDSCQH